VDAELVSGHADGQELPQHVRIGDRASVRLRTSSYFVPAALDRTTVSSPPIPVASVE
jgi:hypothetical protein